MLQDQGLDSTVTFEINHEWKDQRCTHDRILIRLSDKESRMNLLNLVVVVNHERVVLRLPTVPGPIHNRSRARTQPLRGSMGSDCYSVRL
jgi:hypothetical protein